jgi:hypothetical protein
MNKITDQLIRLGTLGELLVQLRLLEFGVQAAPPLKDSGNDLIAIRGRAMRAIQVKTTKTEDDGYRFRVDQLPPLYDALAIVKLEGDETTLHLERSRIFLLPREDVRNGLRRNDDLEPHRICAEGYKALQQVSRSGRFWDRVKRIPRGVYERALRQFQI